MRKRALFGLCLVLCVCIVIYTRQQQTKGNQNVSLNIWDIAGQAHFKSIRNKFYTGAEAAIVIFDVTRPETFEHIKEWILETNEELKTDIPMILVGNKIDLHEQRKVDVNESNGIEETQQAV